MTFGLRRRTLLLTLAATALRGREGREWVLTGTVVDARHRPVARAVVVLTNTLTGKARAMTTGRRGYFRFDCLSELTEYEVTARLGRNTSRSRKVAPLANEPVVLIELELIPTPASHPTPESCQICIC